MSKSAIFGAALFTFVLFLQRSRKALRDPGAQLGVAGHASLIYSRWRFHSRFRLPCPLGVLVGVLIALSRMSSDGEIIAMRARRSSEPQGDSAGAAVRHLGDVDHRHRVALADALFHSAWNIQDVLNHLASAELTSEVQPQVFDEGFPNRIVYISDVTPGAVTRWRNVFHRRHNASGGAKEDRSRSRRRAHASRWPRSAIAVPDVPHNQIQLTLQDGATYDVGKDLTDYYTTAAPTGDAGSGGHQA